MSDRDLRAERTGRPVQATPEFFADLVDEHVDREEVAGGICQLRMADGGRRRFLLDVDVDETDEDAYLRAATDDLVDLLESTEVGPADVEVRIEVDDPDRVAGEAREDGAVTVRFDREGLSGLLAACLAELAVGNAE